MNSSTSRNNLEAKGDSCNSHGPSAAAGKGDTSAEVLNKANETLDWFRFETRIRKVVQELLV